MVWKSVKLFCSISPQELSINYRIRTPNQYRSFIDKLRVTVKGGNGGNGLPQFGGIGGKGGDVIIKANSSILNLKSVSKKVPERKIVAGNGDHSARYRIVGKHGNDFTLECPVGVTILDEHNQVIGDLNENEEKVVVALGGRGGDSLNQFFGQKGQSRNITIDLKLLADVGLVGFPNAGKSTFLKAISRASPKIANYPFTTINPNLGVMKFDDERQISVADLPGLIEGAHLNYGLGHKFLKHIVRTKVLAFIIDINGFQMQPGAPFRSAFDAVKFLTDELRLYDEMLLKKPAILIVSKMDSEDSKPKYETFLNQLEEYKDVVDGEKMPSIDFSDIIPISSVTSYNIPRVRKRIRELIECCFEEQRDKLNVPKSFQSILERERNSASEEAVTLI